MTDKVEIAKAFLVGEKRVKFAYLFGSVASGTAGPLSDLDLRRSISIARLDLFTHRLRLMEAGGDRRNRFTAAANVLGLEPSPIETV